MSGGADRDIERLLEQAARDAQPRSHGWDALPTRLATIPQVGRRWYGRWAFLVSAAAMAAVVVGLVLYFAAEPTAVAAFALVQVIPQDVEITVFNETETQGLPLFMPVGQLPLRQAPGQTPMGIQRRRRSQGAANAPVQWIADGQAGWGGPMVRSGMALVKDHRLVLNLKKGDNIVRFTDVAATIDPTSVRFVSDTDPTGTVVVEQNFEYDLATADALLNRYIDKKVACILKDGAEVEGYLCSYDDGAIVLAEAPPGTATGERKTQTVSRDQLRAIRFADVPPDLFVKPTLVWKLRTQRPGRHDTTLSYVCGETKWNADYVAVVTPGDREQGDRLDLQGWVTIDNRSGATYRDAKIKLIAGDVNRVPDPWAVMPPFKRPMGAVFQNKVLAEDSDFGGFGGAGFVEESFFEYHLYTLSFASTVKDQQIKQLKLLKADGVKAKRLYVSEELPEATPTDGYTRHAEVRLVFRNEEANSLGLPLPKGQVRLLQRDVDGDLGLIGQVEIDHTPKDEEMKLKLGEAFDVTAERTALNLRQPSDRRELVTIELRMRNHRDEPINARFVEHMVEGRNWTIAETTAAWKRENVNTVHFDFVLGANEEKTITYTVDYQW